MRTAARQGDCTCHYFSSIQLPSKVAVITPTFSWVTKRKETSPKVTQPVNGAALVQTQQRSTQKSSLHSPCCAILPVVIMRCCLLSASWFFVFHIGLTVVYTVWNQPQPYFFPLTFIRILVNPDRLRRFAVVCLDYRAEMPHVQDEVISLCIMCAFI